jgi:Bacterial Ig-like domain/Lamin Tail Domain
MARVTRVVLLVLLAAALGGGSGVTRASDGVSLATNTPGSSIVISQLYGSGGNSGATYDHDFIELHNVGASSVDLDGWSVQYASATGTTWSSKTDLSGTLPAGRYFLIEEATGGAHGSTLPTPDLSGNINLSATAGKVALVSSTTALGNGACTEDTSVLDLVGYGAANCSETSPAPAPSATNADIRAGSGCTDTDDNSADFASSAANPLNTTTMPHYCRLPKVSSTTPADSASGVAVDSSLSVTFNEPVDLADGWYTISCGTSGSHTAGVSGGPTTFTIDPDTDFAHSESCTATIVAADVSVNGSDTMAADYVFAFTTAAAPTQYKVTSTDYGPVAGRTVTISAQLADADGNPVAEQGRTVNWSRTMGGQLSDTQSTTNSSGVATVHFTTATVAGTVHTVTATDGAESSIFGTSDDITTVPGPFAKLQLLVPGETAAPGTTSGKTGTPIAHTAGSAFNVTVRGVDAHWNKVSTVADTVHLASSDSHAVLPANAALVSGQKSFSVKLKTAGSRTIAATDVTTPAKRGSSSPGITVEPGAFVKLLLLVPGQTADPGSATGRKGIPTAHVAGTSFTVTVKGVDAYWNRVPTATDVVHIGSSDSHAALSAKAALVSGSKTFAVTLKTAGSATTVYALDVTNAAKAKSISPAIRVTPAAPHLLACTSSTAPLALGSSRTLTVEVRDAYGNKVKSDSGRTVTFAKVSGAGTVSGLGSSTTLTGVAKKTVKATGVGSITISASAGGLLGGKTAFTITR